jgi:hypothetical protein
MASPDFFLPELNPLDGFNGDSFTCWICRSLDFPNPRLLSAHYEVDHRVTFPSKCSSCGLGFAFDDALTRHARICRSRVTSHDKNLNATIDFFSGNSENKAPTSPSIVGNEKDPMASYDEQDAIEIPPAPKLGRQHVATSTRSVTGSCCPGSVRGSSTIKPSSTLPQLVGEMCKLAAAKSGKRHVDQSSRRTFGGQLAPDNLIITVAALAGKSSGQKLYWLLFQFFPVCRHLMMFISIHSSKFCLFQHQMAALLGLLLRRVA